MVSGENPIRLPVLQAAKTRIASPLSDAEYHPLVKVLNQGGEAATRLLRSGAQQIKLTVNSSIAPSAQLEFSDIWSFFDNLTLLDPSSLGQSRVLRAKLFERLERIKEATGISAQKMIRSQSSSLEALPILGKHAAAVVERHARLASEQATGATIKLLDAFHSPNALKAAIEHLGAAMGYRQSAFGAAQDPNFIQLMLEQARNEIGEGGGNELLSAISLQILHESLGAIWRDASEAHRLQILERMNSAL